MESQKREYIDKLKKELDVVEDKWWNINNQSMMLGEDYRSHGIMLMDQIAHLNGVVQELEEKCSKGSEDYAELLEKHTNLMQVNECE